jgi:hypothetical protein
MNVLKNTKSTLLIFWITAKCECPEKYKIFIANYLLNQTSMNVLKNTKYSLLALQITAKCECPEKYKIFIVNPPNHSQVWMFLKVSKIMSTMSLKLILCQLCP